MSGAAPFQAPGHSTVSPYLMVEGAEKAVAFAREVFGAETLMLLKRDDGSVMHCSIRIGDSVVMIADATTHFPPVTAWMHVYVPDVDKAYAQALASGATSLQAPSEKGDGDRRSGVRDPFGNAWWIATHVGAGRVT